MRDVEWAIKATPADVMAAHEAAVKGDRAAARRFVLHSVWREIERRRNFSKRAKVRAFAEFAEALVIKWQTPETA